MKSVIFTHRNDGFCIEHGCIKPRTFGLTVMNFAGYWDLVSGPGGCNRPEVDYAVYLQYHMRIAKTLTNADTDDSTEDEALAVAQEDWGEGPRFRIVLCCFCIVLCCFCIVLCCFCIVLCCFCIVLCCFCAKTMIDLQGGCHEAGRLRHNGIRHTLPRP